MAQAGQTRKEGQWWFWGQYSDFMIIMIFWAADLSLPLQGRQM